MRILAARRCVVAPAKAVADYAAAIRKAVESFHRANPLLPGIPKQELRGRAGRARVEMFEAALGDLVQARALVVSGDLVREAGREITLSTEETRAKELIEREFESAGLTVPGFASVLAKLPVDAPRAQKILQILLREKVLVKISSDLVFHRSTLEAAARNAGKIPQGTRRPPADHCIQGTYGHHAKVCHPVTGTPRPRAGYTAGRG